MKNVENKIEQYKEALQNVSQRKKLWAEVKKSLIHQTLLQVQQSAALDWGVQLLDDNTTPQAVNLHFYPSPSDILEISETSRKRLVKHGGALIFGQGHNGCVYVVCSYPYVDTWVNQQESKVFEKVDPVILTREFILKQVEKFLDEMRIWEDSSTMTRIGLIPS